MNTAGVPGAAPTYPVASLYVGDLHPDVTEAQLYEKFSQSGPVLSIRVCRDLVTRRSLGYAYVNFQQPGDAERALDTMNFDELKGIPMRIMWSQRDPSVRKNGVGNIFIKNLDKTIDHKQLYDTFSQFGNILSSKIVKDEKGGSKGYGFVHFESKESAQTAIDQVDGMLLNDRKVFVGWFKSKADRVKEMGDRSKMYTNVFIKNLPDEFTQEDFESLCAEYGATLSVRLMTDTEGKSKCFGFASFEEHDVADACVAGLNDKEMKGKVVFAGRAQKKNERASELKNAYMEKRRQDRQSKYAGVNLYVKNLDDTVTDDMLMEAFQIHGTITSAKVMGDSGVSKGFGFVCFSSPEEATKALTEMNGRIVGTKPLYVALAQRKEDRKVHLQQQYLQRAGAGGVQRTGMPGMPGAYPMPGAYAMPGLPNYAYMQQMAGGGRLMNPAAAMGLPRYGSPAHLARQPFPPGALHQRAPMPRGVPMNHMGPRPGQPQYLQVGGMMQQQRMVMPPATVRPSFQQQGAIQAFQSRGAPSFPGHVDPSQLASVVQAQQQAQLQAASAQQAQASADTDAKPEMSAATLAQAQPSEQKQMLGERIYPLVSEQIGAEQAGKITGMLLEIENSELLLMIENKDMLQSRIKEACDVLATHSDVKDE